MSRASWEGTAVVRPEWQDARIVAVDDHADLLFMLRHFLERAGYRSVETTTDPRDFLERYDELRPDLVLLDLGMPSLDGFDVLERLQERIADDDLVPVVVLTASADELARDRALSLGAHDFVSKPFDRAEVLLRIRNHLRTRFQHLELRRHSKSLADEVEVRGADLALFREVFESITDAVVIVDPSDGEVLFRNAKMRHADRALDLHGAAWGDGQMLAISEAVLSAEADEFGFEGVLHDDTRGTATPVHVVIQTVDHQGRPLLVAIARDISDQKAAEAALTDAVARERGAHEELRRLNELKNALLSAVNHELRTPLTLIVGIGATLDNPLLTLDDVRRLIPALRRRTKQVQNLLDDLLDLDRLHRGTLVFEPRRSDLAMLAREVVDEAPLGDHELVLDLPPVEATVDRPKFRRIVSNLLRNAGRHTPEGCTVSLRLRGGEIVRLSVVDDGPGVPDHLKDRIFEPFAQGEPRQTHQPGIGVGLSLVRIFAEVHGGRAWVEDAPGGGSAFHVELPRVPSQDPFGVREDLREPIASAS